VSWHRKPVAKVAKPPAEPAAPKIKGFYLEPGCRRAALFHDSRRAERWAIRLAYLTEGFMIISD
jgi:hypothetical protein